MSSIATGRWPLAPAGVRLEDDFVFEDAGEVDLKGKGTMHSWFLIGEKEGAGEVIELKKKRR